MSQINGFRGERRHRQIYLGNENDVALGLADAATAIVAYESEACDARGADLAVQAGTVGNPLQGLGANSTTILHVLFLFGEIEEAQ